MIFFEILKRQIDSVNLNARLYGIHSLQKNEEPLIELPKDLQCLYQILQKELEKVQDVIDRIDDQEVLQETHTVSNASLRKSAKIMQNLLDEFAPRMKYFTLIEVIFDSEIRERFSDITVKYFRVREGKFLVESTESQYQSLNDFLFKIKAIELNIIIPIEKQNSVPQTMMN